jgi:hypothetical protein
MRKRSMDGRDTRASGGLHRNDKGRSCAVISQFYAPSQISARLPWHH